MCGLAGYFQTSTLNPHDLVKMIAAISHRGPDGSGFYTDNNLGLGHCRLSIFDLSAKGYQPMTYQESGCWVVFNGAIYNYLELKFELKKAGFSFHTDCDTEVLLAAYLHWGIECLSKFNGMFAFALYDAKHNTLYLCRDRYGVKPLHYWQVDQGIVFGSELKAFAAVHEKLDLAWDLRSCQTMIQDSSSLMGSGNTLFNNVKSVLPGHYLTITPQAVNNVQWWQTFDHLQQPPKSFVQQVEQFRELFVDACRLRLRSDVPFGISLSGGLDSSSIAAALERLGQKPTAFTHCYDHPWLDERHYTDQVIHQSCSQGYYITENAMAMDPDQALYDYESIPAVILPHSASRIFQAQNTSGFKISIDGHGADELLAGYYYYLNSIRKDCSVLSPRFYQLLAQHKSMGGYCPPNFWQHEILKRLGLKRVPLINEKVRHNFLDQTNQITLYKVPHCEYPDNFSHLQKELYRSFHHTLLPMILRNFDNMSMRHAIEVRMPFLDYRLVNFCFSLPDKSKVNTGYSKLILRAAMKGMLPEDVRTKKMKIPFKNPPVANRLQNELRDWVETVLTSNPLEALISLPKMKNFYYKNYLTNNYSASALSEFCSCLNAIRLTQIFFSKNKKIVLDRMP